MSTPQDPFVPPDQGPLSEGGFPPPPGYPPPASTFGATAEGTAANPYAVPTSYGDPTGLVGSTGTPGQSPSGQPLSSPGRRLGGMLLTIVLVVVTLGIGYLVWALIAWGKSTTPAKQVLGMTVVNARTGAPCTYGEMVMRQVVWSLVVSVGSAITFGVLFVVDALMIFFGGRNQRLVDRMAGTLVVDGRPPAA